MNDFPSCCQQKRQDDVETISLWMTNTCRLLHNLKQYSGEKVGGAADGQSIGRPVGRVGGMFFTKYICISACLSVSMSVRPSVCQLYLSSVHCQLIHLSQ